MVAIRLEEDAIDYVAGKLAEAEGGLAGAFRAEALWEPVVFVPDFADPLTLPALDQGGVANQEGANAELVSYLLFLKQRNAKLQTIIFDDPWATAGDMDYAGTPPDELITVEGKLSYVYDITELTPDLIWQYRAVAVSYLKLIYVSEMAVETIRELAEEAPDDLTQRLTRAVRHLAVNVYDDESWLILRHEDH
ncbi:MAG: hypothetical protein P4L57_02235 [Rhizomicrobium sp.]|nr:hypothetical protein [Rhizomicrobium sp.]